MILIDGIPAPVLVARALQSGLIQPAKPPHYKSPEEAHTYEEKIRARQRLCMKRLRERRRLAQEAQMPARVGTVGVAA